jgi:hypothetical protein
MQLEYFIIGDPYKLLHVLQHEYFFSVAINGNYVVEDQHAYISRKN